MIAGVAEPATRRDIAALQAIAELGAAQFAGRVGTPGDAIEVLAWAGEQFGDSLAVACSMAADTVLVDLAARAQPGIDVLFLDTGYHFADTLGTRALLAHVLEINVVDVRPKLSVAEQDHTYGVDLFARDPTACCGMRKVEPLNDSLTHYEAWITGVRREDNAGRAHTELIEWDAKRGMVKLNPLAGWDLDQVMDYAAAHKVPLNPLLADGFASIGCEPCTRRVAPGEDPRAGRWAGLTKTECGIHV